MRNWLLAAIGLSIVVCCVACAHKRLPGLRVEVSPSTEKVEARKLGSIVATFDRAMLAPSAIGQVVKAPPMSIKPDCRGTFRFTTARTLTFVPEGPLARATRYKVIVSEKVPSLDGHVLEAPFEWSFETERPEAHLSLVSAPTLPSPTRWGTSEQTVALELSQPTAPRSVRTACAFHTKGSKLEVKLIDEEGESPRQRFKLAPASALSLASHWSISCNETLVGIEGPLGLTHPEELSFETYGPMRVVGIKPDHGDVDLDQTELAVQLSNPLGKEVKPLPFSITPPVRGFPERLVADDATYKLTVNALEPNAEYTVRVAAPITDVFGQKLAAPFEAKFRTGDAKPKMDVETGSWAVEAARGGYSIWVRNLSKIEATIAQVPIARIPALLPQLNWWDDRQADLKKAHIASVTKTLKVPPRSNHWQQYELSPSRLLGAATKPTGFFYLSLRAREAETAKTGPLVREVFLNLTNLGLTSKLAEESGLLWLTALDTGKPVADAEVLAIGRNGRTLWEGKTEPDGTVRTPGRRELHQASTRQATAVAKREPPREVADEGNEEFDEETGPGVVFVARVGDDATFINPLYAGGLAKYNFRLKDGDSGVARTRGYLHSDRGLYRPGDTVHLKGLVRIMQPGEGLRIPDSRSARVLVRDPRDQEVLSKELALGEFGGFSLDVPIAEDARLGDYQVVANIDGVPIQEHFSVEEYRPNTFELKVEPLAARYTASQTLRAKASARYLYGAPMRKGKIHWTIHTKPRQVSFDQWRGYEFNNYDSDGGDGSERSQSLVSEEDQMLDGTGNASYALKLLPKEYTQRVDLLVSAAVEDETHQSVTRKIIVPIDPSDRYLGIQSDGWVYEANKPRSIRVVAVDVDGKRAPSQAKLTIKHVKWHCAYEAWGYRGSYRCERLTEDVESHGLDVTANEPATVRFAPVKSGEYEIRVDGKDTQGRSVSARTYVWSHGGDEPAWRVDDTHRFEIIADKEEYRPGETAHLVLKAPVAADTVGLLTMERDAVLDHRLITLGGPNIVVDVPLSSGHAPNVYASLLLVNGRLGKGARGLPTLRMGLVDLRVKTEGKDLQVTVTPDRQEYRPGDEVTATVEVKDAAGAPVHAEVALAAADEGVLSLIDFKTPNPGTAFYAPWGLGTTTATQYERMAQLPEPGTERYATGGDGSGRLGSLRSRFRATAYWNPHVETDAAGRAVVSFKAPDNLTAYRLMAAVADGRDRFGSAEKRFSVRKPLQLLSAMPRFLSVGDEIKAGVLVLNETGAAGEAVVDVVAHGLALQGPVQRKLQVPPGGRVPVYWTARANGTGEAKLQFSALLGAERDGLEVKLPVVYPAPFETSLLEQGTLEGSKSIELKLPDGVFPGTASLSLSVDPDGLAGMEQGLQELIQYPYGCLEQTTSRLIPLVMVEELSKSLNLPELDGPNLQRFIRAGIAKIGRHQTDEGGFSLWPNGEAESYLTAYGLWGLKVGSAAGHPVDSKRVQAGLAYLRKSLLGVPKSGGVHHELGELGGRAFAMYVLALYGKPDAGAATALLERKERLPRFGQAFLARALAKSLGPSDPAVGGLVDGLLAAAEERGGRAKVAESKQAELGYYMSDDVRTTAIVLDMLLDLRPTHPVIPKLVAELLSRRLQGRYGGGWYSTQDNLYALVALTRYSKTQTGSAPTVQASIGEKKLLSADLSKGAVRVRHAQIGWSELAPAGKPLVLAARGGEAHYSVQVRFQRDVGHQRAESEGLELSRDFLDPRTEAPIATAKAGDTVRVRVKIKSPESRYHVAVTDYLPAGLEPVQTKFVTSAQEPGQSAGDGDEDESWWIRHKEVHDDRVDVFADYLEGDHAFTYLARATTAGRFVVPGTHAEPMYSPDVHATLAPSRFEVKAQ